MTSRLPIRDYTHSRAVVVGTWDYDFLPSLPAAGHSLRRMKRLLTGPLCGWPRDRISIFGNRRIPGNLPDRLITLFENARDVALFYYVGHGQIDADEQLCLGLGGSRTEPHRRSVTSLPFQAVRRALLESPATTKIIILDCCFSGLANSRTNTMAAVPDSVMDKTGGTGAYTMAASSAYATAWYENDPGLAAPQTYFTKYFADLIEKGVPGLPAELRLHHVFTKLRDNLSRDQRPVPDQRSIDAARDFIFAYNAAPPDTQSDTQAELRRLNLRLAEMEAEVLLLRAQQQELGPAADDEKRRQLDLAVREAEREIGETTDSLAAIRAERLPAADAPAHQTAPSREHQPAPARNNPPPPSKDRLRPPAKAPQLPRSKGRRPAPAAARQSPPSANHPEAPAGCTVATAEERLAPAEDRYLAPPSDRLVATAEGRQQSAAEGRQPAPAAGLARVPEQAGPPAEEAIGTAALVTEAGADPAAAESAGRPAAEAAVPSAAKPVVLASKGPAVPGLDDPAADSQAEAPWLAGTGGAPEGPARPAVTRRRALLSLGAAAVVAGASAVAWELNRLGAPSSRTPPRTDRQNTSAPAPSHTPPHPSTKLWQFTAQGPVGSRPTVYGGVVYFGSDDHSVYAVGARSGKQVWRRQTGGVVVSSPAVVDGVVYVGSEDGTVLALDAFTGRPVWTFPTSGPVESSPAVVDGTVYIGSQDGNIYAIGPGGTRKWAVPASPPVNSSPAVDAGIVYIGDNSGVVRAIDAFHGQPVKTFQASGYVDSSPRVSNGLVYFGSSHGYTYALRTGSLKRAWVQPTGSVQFSSPAVAGGTVYIGSHDNAVHALDAQSGTVRWVYRTGGAVDSSPAVTGDTVYVGSDDGNLYALTTRKGHRRWPFRTSGHVFSSPTVVDGVVYFGSDDHNLYAVQA